MNAYIENPNPQGSLPQENTSAIIHDYRPNNPEISDFGIIQPKMWLFGRKCDYSVIISEFHDYSVIINDYPWLSMIIEKNRT